MYLLWGAQMTGFYKHEVMAAGLALVQEKEALVWSLAFWKEGADIPAGVHLVPLWFGKLSGWALVAKETAAGEAGVA